VNGTGQPRFPEVEVSLRSNNPVALIAAVRLALRQAHVDQELIGEFSDRAFETADPQRQRRVCRSWVSISSGSGAAESVSGG
jgi:hypothetical protein